MIAAVQPTVISIQSQVAYGHVGNSAAVFPMQMHGIDVIAVPTVLLSNRPGYKTIRGRVLEAQLVSDLLLGIEERGALDGTKMILSGYLGSPEIAAVVADFVARAKAGDPRIALCLRSRARGSRPRPVRPIGDPAAGPRPAAAAGRYHHAQSFRVRMAVRGQGIDIWSDAGGGANAAGARAVDNRRHQRGAHGYASRRDRDACHRAHNEFVQGLARAHAKTADQPVRHRRPVRLAIGRRPRAADRTRRRR